MIENNNSIYLNTAACGLISPSILQEGIDLYQNFQSNSSQASEYWQDAQEAALKKNIARFIGSGAENIALIPNFSFGINSVVHALKGDEKILLYKKDFPSVYIPFILNNFNIVWIEDEQDFFIDLERMESIIKEQKINVVAISQVQWQSGFKIDLKNLCTLCKKHNVYTIIDATQSLGAVKIDVAESQPDVLIASNYKWMNAGFGTGILYMQPTFAQKFPAKISGAHSNGYQPFLNNTSFATSVTNYEPGSLNMFGFSILNKAIEEKNNRGIENIEIHNSRLTKLLIQKLEKLPVQLIGNGDPINRSSILVIKDEKGLHSHLSKNKIITTARNGTIRISIHFHNTEEDIQAIVNAIEAWSGF